MTWLTIRKVPERCLWAALLVSTVYQSYRYPLQMNSAGTSPTYSDTPQALQLAKFLLVIPLCLIAARYILKRRLIQTRWLLIFVLACMSLYPLLKAVFVPEQFVAYVEVAFWPIAAMTLALASPVITTSGIDKYFRFVFYYALGSNLLQILLFFTIGRLPALAYAHSISVRFGGFLDDPNGFPALVYMLMGWAYYRFSGRRRIITEGLLVLCILVSQSLTGLGFLGLLLLFFLFQNLVRRPKPVVILALAAFFITLGVRFRDNIGTLISTLSDVKLDSVNDHLQQFSLSSLATPQDWLLGTEVGGYHESWWFDSIVNFGLPWTLLCLGVVVVLTVCSFRAFRNARTQEERAVLGGIRMFCLFFLVGNVNIPFFKTFPICFLFFLLSMLVFLGKLQSERHVGNADPAKTESRRLRFRLLRGFVTSAASTR